MIQWKSSVKKRKQKEKGKSKLCLSGGEKKVQKKKSALGPQAMESVQRPNDPWRDP